MRVRPKAVCQILGIMAALWLLQLPGILFVDHAKSLANKKT